MTEQMSIHFWGVRGSHPAPGAETLQFGGNTPCVEVRLGGHTVILDAGTGIIPLGRELLTRSLQSQIPVEALLLFSHLHHDHIQGFPFFRPAYLPGTRLHIYGPQSFELALEQVLSTSMNQPYFPVALNDLRSNRSIHGLNESSLLWVAQPGAEPVLLSVAEAQADPQVMKNEGDGLRIWTLPLDAHPGGVCVYRLEWRGRSLVYATDVEATPEVRERLIEFARGADVIILDAQYTEAHYLGQLPGFPTTQGWGHSTPQMACQIAQAAGVGRLVLYHHEPRYEDSLVVQMEAEAQRLFPGALAGYEGLELNLEPAQPAPAPVRRRMRYTYNNYAGTRLGV